MMLAKPYLQDFGVIQEELEGVEYMSDEANAEPEFTFPEVIVTAIPLPLTLNQIWGDIIKPFTAIAPTNSAFIDATISWKDIGNGYTLDYNSNGILWRVNAAGIPHSDDLEKFYEQQEIIQGYSDNLAAEFNLNDTVGGIIEHWKSLRENQEKESLEEIAKDMLKLQSVTPEDPLYEFKLQEAMNMLDEAQDSVIPGGMKFVRGLNGVINGLSKAVISNPLPAERIYARVMPEKFAKLLQEGKVKLSPNADSWVTAAEDLKGITSTEEMAKKLTLIDKEGALRLNSNAVVEFRLKNPSGIASPINRADSGFVGGGRTAGGARKFIIPSDAEIEIIGIRILE